MPDGISEVNIRHTQMLCARIRELCETTHKQADVIAALGMAMATYGYSLNVNPEVLVSMLKVWIRQVGETMAQKGAENN